jgi:hypothetical protein
VILRLRRYRDRIEDIFGVVTSAQVIQDRETGRSKGFGFGPVHCHGSLVDPARRIRMPCGLTLRRQSVATLLPRRAEQDEPGRTGTNLSCHGPTRLAPTTTSGWCWSKAAWAVPIDASKSSWFKAGS